MIHVDVLDLPDADLRTLRDAYAEEVRDNTTPRWLQDWARALSGALAEELQRRDRLCTALEADLDEGRS